jgi:hypothetical protein
MTKGMTSARSPVNSESLTMNKVLLNRLREPSTWAGISILAALFGIPPGTIDLVAQVVGGVAALAAMALPETPKI